MVVVHSSACIFSAAAAQFNSVQPHPCVCVVRGCDESQCVRALDVAVAEHNQDDCEDCFLRVMVVAMVLLC